MNTYPLLTGTTGPGSVAGRTTITEISVLLPLLLLLSLPGLAQAEFEYVVENGTITITDYTGPGGDVVIPDTINDRVVAAIGDYAFSNVEGLTSVTIPDSVTSVGSGAFRSCDNLTSMTIPASVTRIGRSAFIYCRALTNITIGKDAIEVGDGAFAYCTGLIAIEVDALNPVYASSDGVLFRADEAVLIQYPAAKAGDYEIPEGVAGIDRQAFLMARYLTGVTIPHSVATIGEGAFRDCTGLTNIAFGNGVTSIGVGAFSGCTGLKSVIIPDKVSHISDSAFAGCRALTSITIPGSVTSIGTAAFAGCTSLTTATIGARLSIIGSRAFEGCSSLTAAYFEGDAPVVSETMYGGELMWQIPPFGGTPATIYYRPETSGWGPEFWGSPTMPCQFHYIVDNGTVTITGYTCPCGDVVIPETVNGLPVTGIGDHAFYHSTALTSVRISNSVRSIGWQAFAGCNSLKAVYFEGDAPLVKDSCGFTEGVTIYYLLEASGWGADFDGRPTAPWEVEQPVPFDYTIESGGVAICKYTGPSGDVVIPETIEGLPVTSIKGLAFYGCSVTSVTIPDSVTSIDPRNFYGCTNLASLVMGNGITSIPYDMEIGFCSGCTSLTNIVLPENLVSIEGPAFEGCTSLTTVHFPASLTNLPHSAFWKCTALTDFTVDPANPVYSTLDGILCDKTRTQLLRCPEGRVGDYTIPESVISIGEYTFYNCTGLTSVTIPSVTSIGHGAFYDCASLVYVTMPDSVTSIGSGAFSGCSSLTSVTIPDSVTSIGSRAFGDCTGLTSIVVPCAVTRIDLGVFSGCTGLISVAIHDSVTSIGESAFDRCTSLIDVTIPDSVSSIASSTFRGCSSLTSVTIPDSVTSIGSGAFYGCTSLTEIRIRASVTNIGRLAFGKCTSLTDISVDPRNPIYSSLDGVLFNSDQTTLIQCPGGKPGSYSIPNGVTFIEEWAFHLCTSLTSLTIPNSVTSIGGGAFSGCSSLTSVAIPDSITSIGDGTFASCSSLTSIAIPDSVNSIGESAFGGCTSLISITISDSVTSIGWFAFEGCTGLINITIPDSVTSIGHRAFAGCTGLTEIRIPASVSNIGAYAFGGCTSLTDIGVDPHNPSYCSIDGVFFTRDMTALILYPMAKEGSYEVPDSVTSIGNHAFSGCTGLTSLTIPDSVTSIGDGAFSGCTGLTSVSISESIYSIGYLAFASCSSLAAVNFQGDAPIVDHGNSFDDTTATIYYLPGTSGWGPTFDGRPTALWTVEPVPFEYTFENGTVTITKYTGPGGDVVIPETIEGLAVTSVGREAFYHRTELTSITIPDSVAIIGRYSFSGCTGLTGVALGNATIIEDGAFAWCSSLPSISIPESVDSIGHGAFHGCTSLTSAAIPDGVITIPNWAFGHCTGLTSVTIPDSVTRIDYNAFAYSGLISISIPDSVQRIGDSAFNRCTSLTSVSIGNGVIEIGAEAFARCSALPSITIPNSVTSIGDAAFGVCTELTSIWVPDSVREIGPFAFGGCTGLTTGTIGEGLLGIGIGAFSECLNLASVYFLGDAPEVHPVFMGDTYWFLDVFENTPATVYYRPGTAGWSSEFEGRPTMPWGVVWGSPVQGDVSDDEVVDRNDLSLVVASRNQPAVNAEDPRDLDSDGMITVLDARILVTLFTVPAGFTRIASSPEGVVLEWNENATALKLQSTTDLRRGPWQDVGALQSSTNTVIGTSAERLFFRLVLPE